MKLSKRLGLNYAIALIWGLITCIVFYGVFLFGTIQGEKLRVSELSSGVRYKMAATIKEIEEKGKVCRNLLNKGIESSNEDAFVNTINKEELLGETKVDFTGIVNVKTENVRSLFKDDKVEHNSYKDVLHKVIEGIKEGYINDESGIVDVNDEYYVVTYSKLANETEYVIFIKNADENFYKKIGESTGTSAIITNKIGGNLIDKDFEKANFNFALELGEKDILSYSEIKTINGDEVLYLRVETYRQVKEIITGSFIKLMIVVLIVVISINAKIYSFINRRVIRRIVSMNKEVYKLYEDGSDKKNLTLDNIEDEITDLSISINIMLDRIEQTNSIVKINEIKYKGIINAMSNGFIYCERIKDKEFDGRIVDMNSAAMEMLNLENWEGKKISSICCKLKDCRDIILNKINLLDNKPYAVIEKEVKLSDNRWGIITINMIREEYFFIIINEVTKIKLYSEEMTYLANYDPLTSIYNRRKLLNYISELKENKVSFNFFYIDLDCFKKLNDTLGHENGDFVLKEVSKKLVKLGNDSIKVGRLGGDEFVVIIQGDFEERKIKEFGKRILSSIRDKYKLNGRNYQLNASIGVASYPKDAKDISNIIKYADISMYNSKINGGNIVSIFNEEIKRNYELENKIKEGIAKKQFVPYFQPIYDVKKNRVDTVEVLVRWNCDDEILAPYKFLDVAKGTGLIAEIDKNIFIYACEFCVRWKEKFGEYINISVNISNSLLMKKTFTMFILETADRYKIPNEFIRLEITEDEIIKDIKYVVSILQYLKDRGIKIALDDFGTGYSTYSYINILPLDVIKIDRSLIVGIEDAEKSISIVESLINLSKSLNLETICEGIENKKQLDRLIELNCDKVQGYLFNKPVTEEEMINYIIEFENTAH